MPLALRIVLQTCPTLALLERAGKKADAGRREVALHLLDIVLGADPENKEARRLSIAVHQSLLEDARRFRTTGNFWLEGWLEKRIEILGGGQDISLASILR